MPEYEVKEDEENDCGICMMKMKLAVKLYCGHCYHSSCIVQMLHKGKKCCPVCQSPFDRNYASDSGSNRQNVLGSIVRGVINPLLIRRRRTAPERDIEYIRRVFPSIPRGEIEAEILASGSVEQAILNISERI